MGLAFGFAIAPPRQSSVKSKPRRSEIVGGTGGRLIGAILLLGRHHKRKAPRWSQGSAGSPQNCGHISSRQRDACRPVRAGFIVVLSEVSSIGLPSIQDSSPRPGPCCRLRHSGQDTFQTSESIGHRPPASGTPGIRGAHNSGCLGQ